MELSRQDLERAVADGVITADQADALWAALERRAAAEGERAPKPRFDFVHVAYYFGALIVIGAMGWFMTLGWEQLGGGGICAVALGYAACFVLAGRAMYARRDLRTPGGLVITMAVGMAPLAIYGFERAIGWWPESDPGNYRGFHEWVKGGWFAMEIGTIVAGAVALRFWRFPFLTSTLAFTLWYMSMDLCPLLYGEHPTWNQRAGVSAAVGAMMLVAGYAVDRLRTREDFAFWIYLFGLMAFWGGLSSLESDSEPRKLVYLFVNLGLMFVSLLLDRRTFIVFGAMGVMGYLGHLSYVVFKDSMLFPFALSAIGIAIIAFGVHAHRNRARYERLAERWIPAALLKLRPPARDPRAASR